MKRSEIFTRIRSYTRDLSGSIFRNIDLTNYTNEAIDRLRSRVPELSEMVYLESDDSIPTYLPVPFHFMIAIYASARCFAQDERHYQASTLMNEFEVKLEEMIGLIQDGMIAIKDPNGDTVDPEYATDFVKKVYFDQESSDTDSGVEGL